MMSFGRSTVEGALSIGWRRLRPGWLAENGCPSRLRLATDKCIESFIGRMRDELLNESLFVDLNQARQLISDWGDSPRNL
jgi:hypothetical protein